MGLTEMVAVDILTEWCGRVRLTVAFAAAARSAIFRRRGGWRVLRFEVPRAHGTFGRGHEYLVINL